MQILTVSLCALIVGCAGYSGRLPESIHRWAAHQACAQRPHEHQVQRRRLPRVLLKMVGEASVDDVGGKGLFSDFMVEESFDDDADPPIGSTFDGEDEDDDDEDWEGVYDADWDEPSGPEEPPDGVVVESIAKYLPQLMRKKYGEDWELLLADEDADDPAEDEGAAGGGVFDVDGVADPTDGPSEAELQALVAKARKEGEEDGEADEDEMLQEAMAGEIRVAELDVSNLAESSPGEIAESLSPKLAEFLSAQLAGDVALPKPFPQSEWLHVFIGGVSTRKRFDELANTWANLRVLLADNFAQFGPSRAFRFRKALTARSGGAGAVGAMAHGFGSGAVGVRASCDGSWRRRRCRPGRSS